LTDGAAATALLAPEHADAVPDPQIGDPSAHLDDLAGWLMAGHEGRLERKHAMMRVQVGVAHARGVNPNQHLARRRTGIGPISQTPRLVELVDDSCAHGFLPA